MTARPIATDSLPQAAASPRRPPRAARRILVALLTLVGLNAVVAGALLVATPDGSLLGMQPGLLRRGPFGDFLVPGLVLLTVNGLGSLLAGVALVARWRGAEQAAGALGAFLLAWILVQVAIVGPTSPLQALLLVIGAAELGLALRLDRDRRAGEEGPRRRRAR